MRWTANRAFLAALLLPALMAGCATVDRKVDVLYQPIVHGTGGAGDLYLSASGRQLATATKGTIQWIVGTVKNKDGDKTGNVVTGTAPVDQVMDALKQELAAAGYTVIPADKLPQNAARAVDVAAVTIELDETSDLVKSDGISRLTVSIDLWKNGQMIRKLEYKSMLSDFAVKDRDLLLPKLLQKSLQEVMKQAIPEIVRGLSG
jgi:hypothetical protein